VGNIRKQTLLGANGFQPVHYALANQPNSAGGGAGASVTIDYSTYFQGPFGEQQLPDTYSVAVTPNQAAAAWVTG
jgi:hypothetical protein